MVAIGGALAGVITALTGLLVVTLRLTMKTHKIVNSQRTAMMVREEVLIAALNAAGIKIPPDDSLVPDESLTPPDHG